MRILIAEIIRSFSQKIALTIQNDPIFKKLKSGQLEGLVNVIDGRIDGWKDKPDLVKKFQALKKHVEENKKELALTLYETDIFPAVNEMYGPNLVKRQQANP